MILHMRQAEPIDEAEQFRSERIAMLRRNEQPLKLRAGPKFVLHLVPHNAFRRASFEGKIFEINEDDLKPMATGGWSKKVNFDGISSVTSRTGESDSYVQLFHNGAIESVNVSYFVELNGQNYIPMIGWEDELIKRIRNYLNMQRGLGVDLPVYTMISVLSVEGYQFMTDDGYPRSEGYKIDRKDLVVPSLEINSFECDIEQVVLPAFNRLWNAVGRKASFSYNSDGTRKRR
jgi:hypothetical protein